MAVVPAGTAAGPSGFLCQAFLWLVCLTATAAAAAATTTGPAVFFVEHPANATAAPGDTVQFACATRLTSVACNNVFWVFAPGGMPGANNYTTACTAKKGRYLISLDAGRSVLEVQNVTGADAGTYTCLVLVGRGSEPSHAGVLTVLPPTPLCSYFPAAPAVGETVRLRCQVPDDSPVSVLRLVWRAPSETRGLNNIGPGKSVDFRYVLEAKDNYARFTCTAEVDDAESDSPACTVVPLRIPMTVSLPSPRLSHGAGNGSTTALFNCVADAVPPVSEYTWSVWEATGGGLDAEWIPVPGETGDAASLELAVDRTEGSRLNVTCSASNDIGLTASSRPVLLLVCGGVARVTDAPSCPPATPAPGLLTPSPSPTEQPVSDTSSSLGVALGILVPLLLVAMIAALLVVGYRRRKAASALEARLGPIRYANSVRPVDERGRAGGSLQANALMNEAEVALCFAPEPVGSNASVRIQQPPGTDENGPTVEAASPPDRHSAGTSHGGQVYASIGDEESGREIQPAIAPDGEAMYASVGGGDAAETDKGSRQLLPRSRSRETRPTAGYESVKPTKAVPNAYETVDVGVSPPRSSSSSSFPAARPICMVPPTVVTPGESEAQALYAMPDKTRKSSRPQEQRPAEPESSGDRHPADLLYAKPDKSSKKVVKKYSPARRAPSAGVDSERPPPDAIYAMPDKTRRKSAPADHGGRAGDRAGAQAQATLPEAQTPTDPAASVTSRGRGGGSSSLPRKPQRSPSSRIAGSRVLRSRRGEGDPAVGLQRGLSTDSTSSEPAGSPSEPAGPSSATLPGPRTDPHGEVSGPIYAGVDDAIATALTPDNEGPIYAKPDKKSKP